MYSYFWGKIGKIGTRGLPRAPDDPCQPPGLLEVTTTTARTGYAVIIAV
jgi:hypothetical protein